jgi:hypothetical protein
MSVKRFVPAATMLAAFLVALPGAAVAQQSPARGDEDGRKTTTTPQGRQQPATARPSPGENGGEVDQELRQTIQDLMVVRLERTLQLTDAQKEKVVPLVKELTEMRRDHARQRVEAIRSLYVLSQDSGADDQRLKSFDEQEEQFRKSERSKMEEIRSHLQPRQQAQLLGFEERFRNEMRTRLEEVRQRRGPGGRMGRPAGRRRPLDERVRPEQQQPPPPPPPSR